MFNFEEPTYYENEFISNGWVYYVTR